MWISYLINALWTRLHLLRAGVKTLKILLTYCDSNKNLVFEAHVGEGLPAELLGYFLAHAFGHLSVISADIYCF